MHTTAQTPHSKATSTRTINVRVPESLYLQLEKLAAATARTKSFVTVEALTHHLEHQSWQIQDIQAGLDEADQGDFASEAQVNAVFAKHGA